MKPLIIHVPHASIVPGRYLGRRGTGIVSVMLEINKRVLGDVASDATNWPGASGIIQSERI